MKKIEILKKNQSSSLNFFISKIKYYLFNFLKLNFYIKYLKKKFFIIHNKTLFLPFFFDFIIFFRKKKSSNIRLKKKKKKLKFFKYTLKIQKMKPYFFFDLYLKFISFIFKAGKKFFWENSLSFIFSNLSLYLHYSKSLILAKIFMRLFTRVELKKIKSRNRTSFIPFFIKINRSIFLALKWIFSSVVKNTAKISFKNKLYIELLQILTLKSCSSLKKLEDNNTLAYYNRSNTHFRWS